MLLSDVCSLLRRWRRWRRLSAACTLVLSVIAGCGGPPASPPYKPEAYRGVIDESLPHDQQQRQQAVIDLFYELQMNRDFEYLAEFLPHIRFEETREEFLDGMLDLHRWSFAGAPRGNEVSLTLVFREDKEPDYPERQLQRTYTVEKQGDRWLIRRSSQQ